MLQLLLLFVIQNSVETIPALEFASLLHSETVLIDVRTVKEYSTGNIKGAINISVNSQDFNEKVCKLPKDRTILVYCKAGVRSEQAVIKMKALGFKKIVQLKGGYVAWQTTFP